MGEYKLHHERVVVGSIVYLQTSSKKLGVVLSMELADYLPEVNSIAMVLWRNADCERSKITISRLRLLADVIDDMERRLAGHTTTMTTMIEFKCEILGRLRGTV